MKTLSPLQRDDLLCLVLALGLIAIPLLGPSNYLLGQITLFVLWAAVVTQWNLVFGVAGILSIGHLALFAAGGYATALLGVYFDLSLWLTLPVAALAGLAISLFMGLTTLRLRGAYVVVMTLAIAMTLYQIIVTDVACFRQSQTVCYSFSGGARGLSRYGDFGFRELLGYKWIAIGNFYVAVAALVLGTLVAIAIIHSPYGKAFQAMRDNEVAASARGIEVHKYQLIVFAVAGLFTGLTGGVYAGVIGTFGPQVLELPTLLFLLSMMVVGGPGTVWGPILGTAALAFVDEGFRDLAEWRNTGYAVILIIMMLALPDGIVGGMKRLAKSIPLGNVRAGGEQ
ncbi:branched-chain amino acid ABC transporter permease [Methyloligella solikamskensis]|uniref:Branched-chain amino acid ABC transporter permease n=1 Tax=Methyloligella solikamskensis TaxID=1177756 RepID=A0ABW3J752_9HYPH